MGGQFVGYFIFFCDSGHMIPKNTNSIQQNVFFLYTNQLKYSKYQEFLHGLGMSIVLLIILKYHKL